MKTKTIFSFLVLLMVTSSFSALAQKENFSGKWNLDKEKTVLADDQLFLSAVTIQIKNDSLLSSRIYENSYGEQYPFDENLPLNGTDCKIVIYDMPRTTKASRSKEDGSVNIESKTTFNGNYGEEDLLAKETWKVDKTGKTLTIDFTNNMSDVETKGTNFYNKVK
ncbi:MAG TPA: hypothetical protein VMV77_15875 [Bacteroidales bacterium]|nr:hypothetical protein [Bacteroidales bacterium]